MNENLRTSSQLYGRELASKALLIASSAVPRFFHGINIFTKVIKIGHEVLFQLASVGSAKIRFASSSVSFEPTSYQMPGTRQT